MNYKPGDPIRIMHQGEWQTGNVLEAQPRSLVVLVGGGTLTVTTDRDGWSPLISPPF